jgi:membrane-bound ClpP family serine protease
MGLIIAMIVFGLVLLFAEIMLIPGIGVAGILGVISMGGSCYLAFVEYDNTAGFIVLGVNVVLWTALLIWVLRSKTWKKMALETNITSKVNVPEIAVAVGDKGVSATRLAPMGNVRFANHSLEATAMDGMIASGVEVEVVLIDDKKIYVRECK